MPVTKPLDKKELRSVIDAAGRVLDAEVMLQRLGEIQRKAFEVATMNSFSLSVVDCVIPSRKAEHFQDGANAVRELERAVAEGRMSKEEAYEKTIRLWDGHLSDLHTEFTQEAGPTNPLVIMAKVGARASMTQISQMSIAKGLVTDASNHIIPLPIAESLREGLSPVTYFQSCSGSRKSMADKLFPAIPLRGKSHAGQVTPLMPSLVCGGRVPTTRTSAGKIGIQSRQKANLEGGEIDANAKCSFSSMARERGWPGTNKHFAKSSMVIDRNRQALIQGAHTEMKEDER